MTMLRRTSRSWACRRASVSATAASSAFSRAAFSSVAVWSARCRALSMRNSCGHRDDGQGQEKGQGEAAQRGHGRVAPAPAAETLDRGAAPDLDRPVFQEAVQVVGKCGGTGIAFTRLLLQALQADRLQVDRDRGIEPPRRDRARALITWFTVSMGVAAWNGGRPVSSA